MMDNCRAHGNIKTVSDLGNVESYFLPIKTTSKLHPLDGGIIGAMKKRYRKRQMEHVVELLDVGVLEIYKIDISTAVKWLTTVWHNVSEECMRNFWGTTGIVPAFDHVEGITV